MEVAGASSVQPLAEDTLRAAVRAAAPWAWVCVSSSLPVKPEVAAKRLVDGSAALEPIAVPADQLEMGFVDVRFAAAQAQGRLLRRVSVTLATGPYDLVLYYSTSARPAAFVTLGTATQLDAAAATAAAGPGGKFTRLTFNVRGAGLAGLDTVRLLARNPLFGEA